MQTRVRHPTESSDESTVKPLLVSSWRLRVSGVACCCPAVAAVAVVAAAQHHTAPPDVPPPPSPLLRVHSFIRLTRSHRGSSACPGSLLHLHLDCRPARTNADWHPQIAMSQGCCRLADYCRPRTTVDRTKRSHQTHRHTATHAINAMKNWHHT